MPKYKFSEIAYNINQKKMPEPGDEEMYIGLEHLDSGSLKVKRWGSDVPITGEKLVMKKGDILFGRRNTYLRRAAIAPHDGIFSAHGMIFRPNTAVMDEDYFPFFISSDYFMNAAIRISVGSLSPTVNWKTLKELEFDIPDLESQRKSAELLTAANRLKEAYEILLEETDQLVKSQFIEMFGWENDDMKSIGEIATICRGASPRPISQYITDDDNGVNWIKIGDVSEEDIYITRTAEKITLEGASKSRAVVPGDFILSNSMSFGRPYLVDINGCVHDGWLIISDYQQHLHPLFFYYELRSDLVQRQFDGSANGSCVKNLNSDLVRKVKIHIPPMTKQIEFVDFAKQSDKSKFEIKQSIKNITEVINSLLQQDFNI